MKSVDKTLPYRAAGRHLPFTEGLRRAPVDTALPHSALQRVCLSTETTLLKHQSRIKGLKTYEKVAVLSGTGSSAVTTTDTYNIQGWLTARSAQKSGRAVSRRRLSDDRYANAVSVKGRMSAVEALPRHESLRRTPPPRTFRRRFDC